MLKEITLIIPTHNRHSYLTRVLDYYKDTGMNILVADSSKDKYLNVFNYNIAYHHYPNFSFFKKLNEIVQKIHTPFAFMCADDDFIIPLAIERCLEFLDKNSDYASVQGYYVSFVNHFNKIYFFTTYPKLKHYNINGKIPEERLKQYTKKYMHIFYSIHRTDNLLRVFSLPELNNLNLIELTIGFISVINGKHKMLPIMYSIRETIPGSASSTTARLDSIIKDINMKKEYEQFINSLARYFSEKSSYNLNDSKNIILDAANRFINLHLPAFGGSGIVSQTIFQRINHELIEQIKPVIPGIYNKLIFKHRKPQYNYRSSKYRKELKQTQRLILKHSKEGNLIIKRIKEFNKIFRSFILKALRGFKIP